MTVAELETTDQDLPNVSWDDLPASEPVILPDSQDVPDVDVVKSSAPMCPVCDEAIIREPGSRGRMPKYHPHCRPLTSVGKPASTSRASGKKEIEADKAIELVCKPIIKATMMLMAVDQFAAFSIMTQMPSFKTQLRGVLIRHDKWRAEVLAMQGQGSILGLVFTLLCMVAPIAAHHGLIPHKAMSQMLVNLPSAMLRLAKQMQEGEQRLAEMMEDALKKPGKKDMPNGGKESDNNIPVRDSYPPIPVH